MAIGDESEPIAVIKRKRPFTLAVCYTLLVPFLPLTLALLLYSLIAEELHESQVFEFDVFHPIAKLAGTTLFFLPIAALFVYLFGIRKGDRLEFRDDQLVSIFRGKPRVINYRELRSIRYNPGVSVEFESVDGKRISIRHGSYPVEQIVAQLPGSVLFSLAHRMESEIGRGNIVEMKLYSHSPKLWLLASVLLIAAGIFAAYFAVYRYLYGGAVDFRSASAVKLLILAVIALGAIRFRYRVARGGGVLLSRQGVRKIGEPVQNEIPWSAIEGITEGGGAYVLNSQGAYPSPQVSIAADNALVLPYLLYGASTGWREEK